MENFIICTVSLIEKKLHFFAQCKIKIKIKIKILKIKILKIFGGFYSIFVDTANSIKAPKYFKKG